ncbi:2-oxo-3-hexenedioate decarboxylase/2-keto-4-pentenoate hydratase [Streptomyces sp. TLI_235]|nr:fumarylacetoacetate hydrolase family protein [Streptomyces sp. TLI_235]PBC77068.1 2-oxo-3-hexenedioate decarboxylase/2-keto-4-pentenoate hydratase [Streptomyces sp. TLI_235]
MQQHDITAPSRTHGELAALLRRAEAERSPIAPLTELHDGLDLVGAYAVQDINTRLRLAAGDRLVGRKVGLTSLPMQRQLGVDEPDFGVLFQSMVIPDGGTVASGDMVAPRAEAEIAFVLGRPLGGPEVTADEAREAVSQVVLAVEIIDSRIADWRITLADTVADNASSARVVVGRPVDATPQLMAGLKDESLELYVDGEQAARGLGSEVLGDPIEAVAWLARTLDRFGTGLQPGELVLAGAVHASIPLTPGTRMVARSASGRLPELTAGIR